MIRSSKRNLARDCSGSTAVSFALIIWPLLMIMLATMEFGRMLWIASALQHTATTGARCMGLRAADCTANGAFSGADTKDFMIGEAKRWRVNLARSNITLDSSGECGGTAGFSSTTITYVFRSPVPFLRMLVSRSLQASACFPNQE